MRGVILSNLRKSTLSLWESVGPDTLLLGDFCLVHNSDKYFGGPPEKGYLDTALSQAATGIVSQLKEKKKKSASLSLSAVL